MTRLLRLAVLSLALAGALFATAQEVPIPEAPQRWVTDTAGFLSPQTVSALDRTLESYEQQTGHQILVYIGQTTGLTPIEDWAVRAFARWQVGRKGMDDGVVLFIMSEDRRLRIEVGYGLEGQLPDALASRIINEIIVPRVRAGDQDGAVTTGVNAIQSAISGQALPAAPQQGRNERRGSQPLTLGQIIIYGIIGIFILVLLATNPSLAIWLLMSVLSSGGNRHSRGGGWGGGGFGGGGFGGGGGRSGEEAPADHGNDTPAVIKSNR